ncbi:MAG: ATP-dependent 6-phosphofructokinase [Planctomycetes bacterium]|nr:ATP-dependent 6-phosphofructokinase [Planctomycetota bacterium]
MAKRRSMKRIGILTGGGDCPGLNAVIRAVVKTALFEYGWEAIGIQDGFSGLIENRTMLLHRNDVSGILTRGGTILGTSNTANPFRYGVEGPKGMVMKDVSARVVRNVRAMSLDALVCIGGDGTMHISRGLCEKGVPVVGVPKTIDNDLAETDVTFGFDTAVQTISNALDNLHATAMSHHRVMVVETMGRYAGWLALAGGLAGGGDVILIPEIPYRMEAVCGEVLRRSRAGKRFSIVVVSEGAKPRGGTLTVERRVEKSTDPIRLGGIGAKLASEIEERTGLESRYVVLGHLQRGGTPTAFDRILATRFGAAAAHLAIAGRIGRMVCLKGSDIRSTSLAKAVARLKTVSRSHPFVRAARDVGTRFGDEKE